MPCVPLQALAQGLAAPSMAAGGWQQRAPRSLKVFLSGAERGGRGLISWGVPPLVVSGTKLQDRDSAMGVCVLDAGPLALPAGETQPGEHPPASLTGTRRCPHAVLVLRMHLCPGIKCGSVSWNVPWINQLPWQEALPIGK